MSTYYCRWTTVLQSHMCTRWVAPTHWTLHSKPATCGNGVFKEGSFLLRKISQASQHYSRPGITPSALPAEWMLHKEVFNMIQQTLGPARCHQTEPPTPRMHQLEARPICTGEECPTVELERTRQICIPTLLPNRGARSRWGKNNALSQ